MSASPPTTADLDIRRRKILFRCCHRGMREMDILLGQFAAASLADFPASDLADLEALLEVSDRDVLGWLTGEIALPVTFETPLYRRLCAFHTHAGLLRA